MKYVPKFQQGKRIIKIVPKEEIITVPSPLTFQKMMDQAVTQPAVTKLVLHFEGFDKKAVKRPGDIWTIGSGLTAPKYVNKGTITEAENNAGVKEHIQENVLPYLMNKPYYSQLDIPKKVALMDLIYNIGPTKFNNSPNLQKALKSGNWKVAAQNMDHGITQSGMGGLKPRREFEQKLFLQ